MEAFRDSSGKSRVINIHPSLLPAFKGLNAYEQAYRAGVKIFGCTVHRVEAEVDSGEILAQAAWSGDGCASIGEIEAQGLKHEHVLFPRALKKLFQGELHGTLTESLARMED
jgi:phosphoribosylglycinamide formyltransferase-1